MCAVGAGDQLVGRSHECDFPAGVETLPALSRPRLDPAASSARIDRDVRTLVEQGLSVYEIDADRLRELRPDVIVTQTLCAVCAVTPDDLVAAVQDWTGTSPEIVSLEPARLDEVWDDIARVGASVGRAREGRELRAELVARQDELAARAQALSPPPRVACLEWLDPLMGAGNWMPELVELAGGVNLIGDEGEHSPWLDFDLLSSVDPDLIALLPCGFDLARTIQEARILWQTDAWRSLRAVRERRVIALDGHQFFNRPGPRLVESLAVLAEALHPHALGESWRGTGWQQV